MQLTGVNWCVWTSEFMPYLIFRDFRIVDIDITAF